MSKALIGQCYQQLGSLLHRQTDELEVINGYLGSIKTAIADNNTEALDELLTQQRMPIAEIETLEQQRHKLLQIYGFEATRKGLENCIEWCDEQGKLVQQFRRFCEAFSTLQRSIQLNALLVNKSQDRVRQSLQLLTGQPASNNTRTYASNGQSQQHNDKRSIAQV